jgi:hypothetical protein
VIREAEKNMPTEKNIMKDSGFDVNSAIIGPKAATGREIKLDIPNTEARIRAGKS